MPRKLLVADKSVVIQKSVGITFAQEDFTVTYVSDGEQALQKAKALKPDIVLLHIGTPKLSGYEVCDAIKKDPALGTTPVLLLVGTQEQFDEPKSKTVKADGYIIKPFESQALISRVHELLSQKPAAAAAPSPPPPAAKPSAPTTPSPTSTIAGQSAYTPPPRPAAKPAAPAVPSPTATISGQVPRDAPLLDLDIAPPAVSAPSDDLGAGTFDFSLDDTLTPEGSTHVESAATAAKESSVKETNEFWDFSDAAGEQTQVTATPETKVELPPADSVFGTDTTEFAIDLSEAEPSEPIIESGPAAVFATQPEPVQAAEEVSFDAGFDIPIAEPVVAEPEPEPEPEPAHSAPAPAATNGSGHSAPTGNLSLSDEQIQAIVTKVFEKTIERIAWEVVPDLAESIIRQELKRLTQDKP
jgi:CheY-like chemotaxis protein